MGVPYQILRSATVLDDSWVESGLCHTEGHRRDMFFADLGRKASDRVMTDEARTICMRCPVQSECFEYALAGDEHGVWGGTTRDERLYYRRWGRMPDPGVLRRRR